MPGLIDSHVHVVLSEVVIRNMESVPLTLMTARAAELMRKMLDRGFTSVRDTGGADWGLKEATDKWLLPGPRLFIAGRAIGPTGGHSDGRRRTDLGARCQCCNALSFSMGIADGVAEVRRAVREEMRQGCDQVKIMMSGGVASPYDPLDSLQFSVEEVAAAVEEAHAFGRYVLTHAYTPEAITRAVKCGVRTIEHGNLVDAPTAKLMAKHGVYMVPNLIAYDAMKRRAKELGMPDNMLEKNDEVLKYGFSELELCRKAGVKMAYGSDLLGALENEQTVEFQIRGRVMPAIDVIRSATLIGAEVVRQEGKLGTIQPGAHADMLVVDGDPLKDLGLFKEGGPHLSAIMKAGKFHKNTL
jgi:imidazolonepropionase-like amidohydrolase